MIDTDKANRIFEAMRELSGQFAEWQTIGAIRETVGSSVTREEFDTIMVKMMELDIIDMVPECNQKTLINADHHNAVKHATGVVWHLAKLA